MNDSNQYVIAWSHTEQYATSNKTNKTRKASCCSRITFFVDTVYQVKSFLFRLYFEEASNEEKTLVKSQKGKVSKTSHHYPCTSQSAESHWGKHRFCRGCRQNVAAPPVYRLIMTAPLWQHRKPTRGLRWPVWPAASIDDSVQSQTHCGVNS